MAVQFLHLPYLVILQQIWLLNLLTNFFKNAKNSLVGKTSVSYILTSLDLKKVLKFSSVSHQNFPRDSDKIQSKCLLNFYILKFTISCRETNIQKFLSDAVIYSRRYDFIGTVSTLYSQVILCRKCLWNRFNEDFRTSSYSASSLFAKCNCEKYQAFVVFISARIGDLVIITFLSICYGQHFF